IMPSPKTANRMTPGSVPEKGLRGWNCWTNELNDIQIRKYCREIVSCGRMLHRRHYVSSTDGNLSVRLDASHVLTTPTGVSKWWMKSEQMVIVDMAGNKIGGLCEPSSEIEMHLTIYKMRPDVHAVVHAHPCTATGFAAAGIGLTE